MRRFSCACLTPLFAGLLVALLPSAGRADVPKAQKVLLETFDKVQLTGSWYASGNDATKSPVVLLLHKIGGSCQQEGWDALAQMLQEKGFAVLALDFRGHGDSKNVKPMEFWNVRHNTNGIRGANRTKDAIDWKEFTPAYYPMLVNDIAAAKQFLEQKNNARECNISDLYVVAAEDGAGLGMLWMASEFNRRKRGINQFGQVTFNTDPEGKDLAALVCLSARPSIGPGNAGVRLNTASIFNSAKMRELPMCFFYGAEDANAKAFATQVYDRTLNAERLKLKLTFKVEMEKTKLAGNELLGKKALGTEELVAKYLGDKVRDARAMRVWGMRDVPDEGKPNLNPLVLIPLSGFGVNYP
jgi:pimeloyl-ACP methyl ester carboxylesterase